MKLISGLEKSVLKKMGTKSLIISLYLYDTQMNLNREESRKEYLKILAGRISKEEYKILKKAPESFLEPNGLEKYKKFIEQLQKKYK